MINLFFSGGASGSANLHKRKLGIQEEIIADIDLMLFAGDISDPFNVNLRRDVYNSYYRLDSIVSKDLRDLKKLLKKDRSLCIWFSCHNTNEYLGMLASVSHFDNKGIALYICDCSDICDGLFDLQFRDDVEPVERHALSLSEKEKYLARWHKLQSENTMLRITKDKRIISLPEDYYDGAIFDFIGDKERKVASVCEYMTGNFSEISDKYTFILMRIRKLIAENKLVLVKEVYDNNDGYYGKPEKNIMKYIVKNKDDRNNY